MNIRKRSSGRRHILPDFISLNDLYERSTMFRKVPATLDVFYLYTSEIDSLLNAFFEDENVLNSPLSDEVILDELLERLKFLEIEDMDELLEEGGYFFMNIKGEFVNEPVVSIW